VKLVVTGSETAAMAICFLDFDFLVADAVRFVLESEFKEPTDGLDDDWLN